MQSAVSSSSQALTNELVKSSQLSCRRGSDASTGSSRSQASKSSKSSRKKSSKSTSAENLPEKLRKEAASPVPIKVEPAPAKLEASAAPTKEKGTNHLRPGSAQSVQSEPVPDSDQAVGSSGSTQEESQPKPLDPESEDPAAGIASTDEHKNEGDNKEAPWYVCDSCDKFFVTKRALKSHLDTSHEPVVEPQDEGDQDEDGASPKNPEVGNHKVVSQTRHNEIEEVVETAETISGTFLVICIYYHNLNFLFLPRKF